MISHRRRSGVYGKFRDLILIAGLAVILVFSVWKVFYTDESSVSVSEMTETEQRIFSLSFMSMTRTLQPDILLHPQTFLKREMSAV